jgi:hypothetical protein
MQDQSNFTCGAKSTGEAFITTVELHVKYEARIELLLQQKATITLYLQRKTSGEALLATSNQYSSFTR